jgi:hypothetical protein
LHPHARLRSRFSSTISSITTGTSTTSTTTTTNNSTTNNTGIRILPVPQAHPSSRRPSRRRIHVLRNGDL